MVTLQILVLPFLVRVRIPQLKRVAQAEMFVLLFFVWYNNATIMNNTSDVCDKTGACAHIC